MDLPFKITFYQKKQGKRREYPIEKFVNSQQELYRLDNDEIIVITENLDTYISFSGENDVRLYMDGLEAIAEEDVCEDEHGDFYLDTLEKPIPIYENKGINLYFPLIPGYYQICVLSEGEKYFSLFHIRTKQITDDQWKVMRDDIEQTLSGLAQDLVRKNTNLIAKKGETILPIYILRKWHLIKQFRTKLITSIQDLTTKPRHEVRKNYAIVPISQARKTDNKTVKFSSQHPEKRDFYKTPYRQVDLFLPENKLVKAMLESIDKTLKGIKSYSDLYAEITHRKIASEFRDAYERRNAKIRSLEITLEEIQAIKKECNNLCTIIQKFLKDSWLKDVPSEKNINTPLSIIMDQRFQPIVKLYKQLRGEHVTVTIDPVYQYNWKRTDLLYEIWSFIQVIEAFNSEEIGFSSVSGWLIDDYPHIPELFSGDKIVMKKGELTIQIIYEGEILGTSKKTTMENPLYTGVENRKPDCRIDYYDTKGYIGSLVLDFKYRPAKSIWSDYVIKNRSSNRVMRQLSNYQSGFKSKWFFKDRIDSFHFNRTPPIIEVWGVYPLQKNDKTNRCLNEHFIRLIDLTPNEDNRHFVKQLKELTDQVLQSSKQY